MGIGHNDQRIRGTGSQLTVKLKLRKGFVSSWWSAHWMLSGRCLLGVVCNVCREDVNLMRACSERSKSHQWQHLKGKSTDLLTFNIIISNAGGASPAARQSEVG